MQGFLNGIVRVWNNVLGVLEGITVGDILDIIIVTYLLYKAIQFIRETHAGQLLKGLLILLAVNIVVRALDMEMMSILLQTVWSIGLIAIIILFQPELRHLLERLGRSKLSFLGKNLTTQQTEESIKTTIDAVSKACNSMSASKTGALIVFENQTILDNVISSGTMVDADVTNEMLCNIFFPKAPLHDGAVIISEGKIKAASCILPLTSTGDINRELGTRHRAAIGLSEQSDAVVVVVSEETGIISIAHKGEIKRNLNSVTLKAELEVLIGEKVDVELSNFEKFKSKWKRWLK